jgi:thioredoxin 1
MTSAHVIQVSDATYENEVVKSDKLVLIDFYADWCGPCKSMAPAVDKFAEENPNVKVVKVNIDQNPQLASLYGIRSIPTLVTVKEGQPVLGMTGATPKSGLEQLVAKTLEKLAGPGNKPQAPKP